MKSTNPNKKMLLGITILILTVVFGYYFVNYENKKVADPTENKNSNNDSVTLVNSEKIPAALGVKPEVNPKDGSLKIVKEFIKLQAKNPETFKFLEWSEVSNEGGYWKVRCKYSGVSSFNAEVTTSAWFYIQNNKVVYTKIISKI